MDLIIADESGIELGFFDKGKLDLDVGDSNDFEITIPLNKWDSNTVDYDFQIFAPGTEYGGIIGDIKTMTKSNRVVVTGYTWRGLLDLEIIEPPSGQDYLILSGDLNEVLNTLIGGRFDDLFEVSHENTGVTVTNYQFERHCTVLYGIQKMFASVGYRLSIRYIEVGAGYTGYVKLEAVPIVNYSDRTEFSQDCKVHFTVRDYRRGINHLICLGKGELKDRHVLHLYVQKDGSIGKEQYFKGIHHRAAIYDYSSVEDVAKLEEDGTKRLKELCNYKECEVTVDDVALDIGDIVSGRDYITGTVVKQPIVQKILRIDGKNETVQYVIKGDD